MTSTWNCTPRLTRVLPVLPLILIAAGACAQNDAALACPDAKVRSTYQAFYLNHVNDRELQEIQTVLRNDLTDARINGIPEQSALTVCGTPAELQLAQKVITDLDHPRKTWRLTFAFTQTENGQHAAPEHMSMVAVAGQRTELRQGNRVPIVTVATGAAASPDNPSTQVQYLDVGLNISATIAGDASSPELQTKIEQSSIADEKSGIGAQDPIVHQTVLDVTSRLTPNKPLVLGSIDIPGTSRHEQVEVTVEPVP